MEVLQNEVVTELNIDYYGMHNKNVQINCYELVLDSGV